VNFTASGFQRVNALTGPADQLEMPFRSDGYRYWKPSREEA
jgi:hypothetical protein